MVNLVRMLVPTDFSEASAAAARHAFALADCFGAELHALHVIEEIAPTLPESVTRMATSPDDYMAEARANAEKALAAWLPSDVAGGHDVVRVVQDGAPLTRTLDYARDHEVDLIVMGTLGRTGLAHFLIGSVAERVVRHAPCPVLTVRPLAAAVAK